MSASGPQGWRVPLWDHLRSLCSLKPAGALQDQPAGRGVAGAPSLASARILSCSRELPRQLGSGRLSPRPPGPAAAW